MNQGAGTRDATGDGPPQTATRRDRTVAPGTAEGVAILSEAMANITVYSTDPCSFCSRAKELLTRRGYAYEEINLSKDPEGRAELVEKTGMFSFPQIVIDGMVLGGFRELVQADMSGKLEELVAVA
jgi:glutaredoxin 3